MTAKPPPQTVFIVDDDAAFRAALETMLRAEGLRTRAYGSAAQFLDDLAALDAGCLLLDVRMPGMSGTELYAWLREHDISVPVVVMSAHADVQSAVEIMRRGAADFLEKPFKREQLLGAIERVLAQRRLQWAETLERETVKRRLGRLTVRERQVLDLLVEGSASKLVADRLGISARTVDVHRSRIMAKFGVHSLAELIRQALLAQDAKP